MDKLIFEAQNGKMIFSNDYWCGVSVITNNREIKYGHEVRKSLYEKISEGFCNKMNIKRHIQIIFDEQYKYLCGLSDPHTALYITCGNEENKKILFVPNGALFRVHTNELDLEYCEFDTEKSTDNPIVLEFSKSNCSTLIEKINVLLTEDLK